MSDDEPDDLMKPESFEVKTDAWALARLHEPAERSDLVDLGFAHLGYEFCRVPGSGWDRGAIGYTVEGMVAPDATAVACLDLFYDVGIITMQTLLEDGTLVFTRFLPAEAERDPFATLTFASRPRAHRHAESTRLWDAPAIWARHQARVARYSELRGSKPVDHGNMYTYFAIQGRGIEIAGATGDAVGLALRIAAGVVVAFFVFAAAGACGWTGLPWWATLGTMLLPVFVLLQTPWVKLVARLTRLDPTPAAELIGAQTVADKVGDHAVQLRILDD